MAILDRTPKTSPAPARKTAPALTHEQLRALPVGYDQPDSPFYVDPADREQYANVAGDRRRMRGWRDSATWQCTEVVVDPKTFQRSAVVRDPDVIVHGWVLDEVRRGQQAQARYAEQQSELADSARCQVCHEAPTPDAQTSLYVVSRDGVDRLAFGLVGASLLAHASCALAVRDALTATLSASLRQQATAYLSTLDL